MVNISVLQQRKPRGLLCVHWQGTEPQTAPVDIATSVQAWQMVITPDWQVTKKEQCLLQRYECVYKWMNVCCIVEHFEELVHLRGGI